MTGAITRAVRSYLTGIDSAYRLTATRLPVIDNIQQTNLYLHIPFCKSLCPYCPYNKITYDRKYIAPYLKAVLNEIEMYYNLLGSVKITSIYIGGGTPTLLTDELGIILERIRNRFDVTGDIGVETSPAEIDDDTITKLKHFNVSLISLGVESFNDKYLEFIGRKYSSDILKPVIKKLLCSDFKSVNADMLFAIPGQSCGELLGDLQRAVDSGLEQITIYPLFTFPYSTIGEYKKLKRVKTPNLIQRHRQYGLITRFFGEHGFDRASVWSYKKGDMPRYSSATRDRYIGLGAGAGSHTSKGFYANTFSVDEYIKSCLEDRFPVALHMSFTDAMQKYFWLYWRLYDTQVDKTALHHRFNGDKKFDRLLKTLKLLGLIYQNNSSIELTDRGAFWVHLMQNHFILSYINKVWSVARRQSWPMEIVLG